MIHYITVHHGGAQWVDTQLKHIEKFTSDYKVWCFFGQYMNTLPHKHKFHFLENHDNFDYITHSKSYDHATKLDNLFKVVAEDEGTKDDDVVIFLDSDAFPIDNVNEYVKSKLEVYDLAAVARPENDNRFFSVHPSFTVSTVAFWKKNNLSWFGISMQKPIHHFLDDTGGLLYQEISKKNIKHYKILKSRESSIHTHPFLFSSYGNIVYHHGAGSRDITMTRADTSFSMQNTDFFKSIHSLISEFALQKINAGYFINKAWRKNK